MDLGIMGVGALRLLLAAGCGFAIGWEREYHEKGAGLRTHMLISVGACLFALVGASVARDSVGADVTRLVQGAMLGIGFIAGGVIFTARGAVRGLTTAAGLWVLTAVGLAAGFGQYFLACVGTLLVFLIVTLLKGAKGWVHTHGPHGPSAESEGRGGLPGP